MRSPRGVFALLLVAASLQSGTAFAASAPLAPLPVAECNVSPTVTIPGAAFFTSDLGLGVSPVWMGGGGPSLTLDQDGNELGPAMGAVYSGHPGYGWFQRRLWLIEGTATAPVTLSGRRLGDDLPMWFSIGDPPPLTHPVLDPARPGIPVQHGTWREFPSYVFYPDTGCYQISAEWEGGGWTATVLFVAPPIETPPPVPACPAEVSEAALQCLRDRTPDEMRAELFRPGCSRSPDGWRGADGDVSVDAPQLDRLVIGAGPVTMETATGAGAETPLHFARTSDYDWTVAKVTFWIAPETEGPILVRLFQQETRVYPAGFLDPGVDLAAKPFPEPAAELVIPPGESSHETLLALWNSGCSFLQFEGPTFSSVIQFEAEVELPEYSLRVSSRPPASGRLLLWRGMGNSVGCEIPAKVPLSQRARSRLLSVDYLLR
jgi:hypothetical protein